MAAAPSPPRLHLSELFLKRIKRVPVKTVMLENAGHYPIEQPGLNQMVAAPSATSAAAV